MKKVMSKQFLTLCAAAVFVCGAPLAASAADKLVIKNTSNEQQLVITDEGRIGVHTPTPQADIDLGGGIITMNGADPAGVSKFRWTESGRVNFGWGGAGGGQMELYSLNHPTRMGQYKFIYGGGDFGHLTFTHFDGVSWVDRMVLTKEGYMGLGNLTPQSRLAVAGLPTSPPAGSTTQGAVCITTDGDMWIDADADCIDN